MREVTLARIDQGTAFPLPRNSDSVFGGHTSGGDAEAFFCAERRLHELRVVGPNEGLVVGVGQKTSGGGGRQDRHS